MKTFGAVAAVLGLIAGPVIGTPAQAQPAPAESATDETVSDWDAEPVSRVAPEYPPDVRIAGREGWVHARLTIQADGSVAAVDVVEAYPRDTFDQSVKDALTQWKYPGMAAPRTHNVLITYLIDGAAAVRPTVGWPLARARTLLSAGTGEREKNLAQAEELLHQASGAASLNVYEFAALEQSFGFLAFERRDYLRAITHLQRARRFGQRLAESEHVTARGQMQEATEAVLISSYLMLGRNAQAVAIYDKWTADHANAFTPALRARIADARGE